MLKLKGETIFLQIPLFKHIDAIINYYERNREHLAPYEPKKPANFYTWEFWRERIEDIHYKYEKGLEFRFFLFEKDAPHTVIGTVNFNQVIRMPFSSCFLGYALDSEYQGKGYITEGIRRGIDYMFEVQNLHRIQANYMPHNTRSAAVLKRLGFHVEGYAKDYVCINGKWEDHIMTALHNPNFIMPL